MKSSHYFSAMPFGVAPSDPGTSLRILHVSAPGSVGGLEEVVRLLVSGQRSAGHDAQVAAVLDRGTGNTPFLAALARADVPVRRIPLPPRAYVAERRRLADVIRDVRPDVVHTHGYRADIQAGAVARRLGVTTVTTVHGFTGGGWRNRVYERLQRRAFRRFGAVVAVSTRLSFVLRAAGVPADRVHVIANAAATGAALLSRAEARRALGVSHESFVVGWVGRISPEKGLDVLIEALARTSPAITAVVLGTGPAVSEAAELARARGIDGRIRWTGVMAEAGRLFPAFDCFVVSSRTEGTPMVLFEAMAAGVPIVSTAVGGVPDVVSELEAVLVPPERPDAVAAAISSIATDPDAARARADAARRRLHSERRPEPWVERYTALYRDLLAASGDRLT